MLFLLCIGKSAAHPEQLFQLTTSEDALKGKGIGVFMWEGKVSFEERIALDLPWEGVIEMLQVVAERSSCEQCVRDAVRYRLGSELPESVDSWQDSPELRQAIGKYVKEGREGDNPKGKGLFKSMDGGEKLGDIIVKHIEQIPKTDIAKKVCELRAWIDTN